MSRTSIKGSTGASIAASIRAMPARPEKSGEAGVPARAEKSAEAGVQPSLGAQMALETILCRTRERFELIDITRSLNALLRQRGMRAGLVIVQTLHTTAALFINEFQQALLEDIRGLLEKLVVRQDYWRHNDPLLSDCDRKNADSHLRAMLLGHTISLPVRNGELALGEWQRVILAELDGPRERSINLQMLACAEL